MLLQKARKGFFSQTKIWTRAFSLAGISDGFVNQEIFLPKIQTIYYILPYQKGCHS